MINTGLTAIGMIAALVVDAYGAGCGAVTLFLNKEIGIEMGAIGTGFAIIFFAYWTSKVSGGGFFKNKKLLKRYIYTSGGEALLSGIPAWSVFVITTSMKNWNTSSTATVKIEEEAEENSSGENFDEPHAEDDLEYDTTSSEDENYDYDTTSDEEIEEGTDDSESDKKPEE